MEYISTIVFQDSVDAGNRFAEVDVDGSGDVWFYDITLNGTDENGNLVAPRYITVDNYNNYGDVTVKLGSIHTRVPAFTTVVYSVSPLTSDLGVEVFDGIVRIYISEKQLAITPGTDQNRISEVSGYLRRDGAEPMKGNLDMGGFTILNEGGGNVPVTPEGNGAKGDGITNDTDAFNKMAAAVNSAGGGVIELDGSATYIVGVQDLVNDGTYMFKPRTICNIVGCNKPVVIRGNGATIKFAPNLKFGTFDANGTRTDHPLPYTGGDLSAPCLGFEGMISVSNCTGLVDISDIVFDGNQSNLHIGGPYNDTGWQIAAYGLLTHDNIGGERISGIKAHDSPTDGHLTYRSQTNPYDEQYYSFYELCEFDRNGRQGVSLTGGTGYCFKRCKFTRTGRGTISSSPGAGIDIEPEAGRIVRNILFEQCLFSDNFGAGVTTANDSQDVTFRKCVFVATTAFGVWLINPKYTFEDCVFIGSINVTLSTAISRADGIKFKRCYFTDDAAKSPTGVTYWFPGGLLHAYGLYGQNTTFEECIVDGGYQGNAGGLVGCVWRNSYIQSQPANYINFDTNSFEEVNEVNAPLIDYGQFPNATFSGKFTLNTVLQMRGTLVYDPPSIANGAEDKLGIITVPGARIGDYVEISFNQDLLGLKLDGYVNANDRVTAVFSNNTGGAVDLPSGTLSAKVKKPAAV